MPALPAEPPGKRTLAFFDGQNLFHRAREAFGYSFPNFDARALARAVCRSRGWDLVQVRFYTGVPDSTDHAHWNHFWTAKAAAMGRQGVVVFTRRLQYLNRSVTLPDGTRHTIRLGEEKGIDVRIALDMLRLAYRRHYDVAILFSQDQDLSEVAKEIRQVGREQKRWIKLACAFPFSAASRYRRGVDATDWIKIDRTTYDQRLDPRDYRLRP